MAFSWHQEEFPELKKRYWGQPLQASRYFCAAAGNVTEEEPIRKDISNQKNDEKDGVSQVEEEISLELILGPNCLYHIIFKK